ncbi:MAG: hypothetical protein ACFFDF_19030 [Candidatus Odinarchaeota archaeon]
MNKLTTEQKKELSEYYFKQYKPFIQDMQKIISNIIIEKDEVAIMFLTDITVY